MAEKELKVILRNRCDTAANWENSNIIPKKGEIILYSDENKIKIGNGNSLPKNLPFATKTYSIYKNGTSIILEDNEGNSSTITDSDTTYVNGEGLDLNTNTFSLSKVTTLTPGTYGVSQSPEHGTAFEMPSLTVDKFGRVTKAETVEIALPVDLDSDLKTSATELTSTKLFILGAPRVTETGESIESHVNQKCFISTDGYLYSGNEKVLTSETPLTTSTPSIKNTTLVEEGTFTAITGLAVNGHTIIPTMTIFTLPQSKIDDGEL